MKPNEIREEVTYSGKPAGAIGPGVSERGGSLFYGGLEFLAGPVYLFFGAHGRRRYKDVVARVALDAALNRVDEQPAFKRRLGDAPGKVRGHGERGFLLGIGDEFYRPEQADSTHIADGS
jgi:hypothetical protein